MSPADPTKADASRTAKGSKGGKGGGKGGKGSSSPAAAGMMGYPGFPMMPGGTPQQNAAFAQMMAYRTAAIAAQAQHQYAAAVAAAHAGQGGFDQYSGAAKPPRRAKGKPLADEHKDAVKAQIEFYFSTDNLCKDVFLRQHMDEEGWTPLDLISSFKRVRWYKATVAECAELMADSNVVEADSAKKQLRLKDEVIRKKWINSTKGPAEDSPSAAAAS